MSPSWSSDLLDVELAAMPVAGRALADWQELAADAAVAAGADSLASAPSVLVSPALAGALAREAVEREVSARVAVELGVEHVEYGPNPVVAVEDGGLLHYPVEVAAGAPSASPLVVPTMSSAGRRPQPGRMAGGIEQPIGDRFLWGLGHWVDVLVANLLALPSVIAEVRAAGDGTDADIHPTAVVERSVVGPGATIGPFAVVRDSVIGAGCQVAEHTSIAGSILADDVVVQTGALVTGSSIGPNTVISFQTAIRGSVLLGGSTISTPVVARSLVGSGVFLARGVTIGASTLGDESITVRRPEGRAVDTGMHLLGVAIGAGARVGNGISLPAGYEVPAGAFIAEQPIPRFEPDLPRRTPVLLMGRKFRAISLRRNRKHDTNSRQPVSQGE